MIKEFFAVTETSVYHVVSDPLSATKIALSGESWAGVGYQMTGGQMLSVGLMLIRFIPEGGGLTTFQRNLGQVNMGYWGGNSSRIVALFLNRKKALACLGISPRGVYDKRWKLETNEVLKAIGEDHPNISIYRGGGSGIPMSFFEK